jgi:putative two-component system response regulator
MMLMQTINSNTPHTLPVEGRSQDLVLLVDDNPRILTGVRMALTMRGFRVITAGNADEAIAALQHHHPALIVSDILMPGRDGFDLLERVHAHPDWVTIPFLFLTALDDTETLNRGRALGVDDYLTKPFSPADLARAVSARIERSRAVESAHSIEAYLRTILVIANAVEARDAYTGGHVERVSDYSQRLAAGLGWSEGKVQEVHLSAILHDIGKISVPDAILNKAEELTDAEWDVMKQHPVRGVEILAPLRQPQMILDGVRYHHERYDGRGYPDGLKGENIPETGRLIAIADAYDAMTSDRAYRKALSHEEALNRLRSDAQKQFDPRMVYKFNELIQREAVQLQS